MRLSTVFWLAFAGKVCASLFLAICVAFGFGPTEWADAVLDIEPTLLGRLAFVAFGVIAFVYAFRTKAVSIGSWVISTIRQTQASAKQMSPETSRVTRIQPVSEQQPSPFSASP